MDSNDIIKRLKEPLNIDDIEFRVQSINNNGNACIVSYKNARIDMNRLDEVCGTNWQNKYELIDGNLHCSIGIKIGDEWIWRTDVGVESNTEKVKGEASDAFKRAAVRWGIGRELYNHPRIFVQLNQNEFSMYNGKARQSFGLNLSEWKWNVKYDEKLNVISMTAIDKNGVVRYQYPRKSQNTTTHPAQQPQANAQQQPPSEKPWLNKMIGQEMTDEWLNVIKGITVKKTVTSIADVEKHYRLSTETKQELTALLKNQNTYNNGSN